MFANSVAGKFLYFDRGEDKDISEFLGSGEGYNFLISDYNETPNDLSSAARSAVNDDESAAARC